MSNEISTAIRQIIADNGRHGVSKNAICQALKRVAEQFGVKMTKRVLLCDLLQVGLTRMGSARYWEESYNILAWESRTEIERDNAMGAALSILRTAAIV